MKKFLAVWSILLALVLMMACAFAEAEEVITADADDEIVAAETTDDDDAKKAETDHTKITRTEYWYQGKILDKAVYEKTPCAYSPVIARNFYKGSNNEYYEDEVIVVAHKFEKKSTTATCTEAGTATWECIVCKVTEPRPDDALGHLWSSEAETPPANNNWGKIVKEATCLEEGLAIDYCLRPNCGAERNKTRVIESPEHKYVKKVLDAAPHCYNKELDGEIDASKLETINYPNNYKVQIIKGSYHLECSLCGTKLADSDKELTLKDYNDLVAEGVAANKKKDQDPSKGLYKGGKRVTAETDGHTWDAWVHEIKVTCEEDGRDVHWCVHCGTEQHQVVAAMHHTKGDLAYDALEYVSTHITDCFTRYDIFKCSLCEEIIYGMWKEDPAKGTKIFNELTLAEVEAGKGFDTESHVFPDPVQPYLATKTITDAVYQAWMKDTTKIIGTKTVSDFLSDYVAPDCTTDGSVKVKCIYTEANTKHPGNHGVLTLTIKKLDHDWSPWVMEHAVGENGNIFNHYVRTCQRVGCGMTEDFNGIYSPDNCPDGEHDPKVLSSKAADCTEPGSVDYICNRCGKTWTETVAATGHNYVKGEEVKATCKVDGYTIYTCENCGDVQKEAGEKATGHDYTSEVVVKATCANGGKAGKILYTCTKCGDLYTEIVKAPDHTVVIDAAVEPTKTTTGLTEGSHCSECGEILKAQEVIPVVETPAYTVAAEGKNATATPKNIDATLKTVYVRITWNVTLANGDEVSIIIAKPASIGEDGVASFKISGVSVPAGSTVNWTYIEVVDTDETADEDTGSYTNYGNTII